MTFCQSPERSGLPSAVFGAGPVRSGLPSAVLGTPGVGYRGHCAVTDAVATERSSKGKTTGRNVMAEYTAIEALLDRLFPFVL
jgi:hypothetical protein